MPCYHPLKGFIIGFTDNYKNKLKITDYKVDHLEYNEIKNIYEKIYTKERKYNDAPVFYPEYDIPCGRCIGCRLKYSSEWAARCCLELKRHDSSYFVTLTYDDCHVPYSTGIVPETGELVTTTTLVKRDVQLFMKRLRKKYAEKYDNKIRYFLAGEYGDKTFRPHYHAIIFGLRLDDLEFYKRSGDFNLYTSKWLEDIWSVPNTHPAERLGMVVVGEANFETAAYVARYVTKKLNGKEAEKYEQLGIIPEFSLMSRKPGIGGDYADENIEHMLDDMYLNLSTPNGGKKLPIPKFYKRKFDAFFEDQDILQYYQWKEDRLKASRRVMESIKQQQLNNTTLSYLDLLQVNEVNQKAKIKGLERSLR